MKTNCTKHELRKKVAFVLKKAIKHTSTACAFEKVIFQMPILLKPFTLNGNSAN
jgi:hypothetical protein